MKSLRQIFAATAVLAALGPLAAGLARAGAAEDYAAGAKRYAVGDLIAAMPLLRRAADAGHAQAQAAIAEILDQSDSSEEAVEYFRKSAAQGNADGQFGLGTLLAAGQGVPKNPAEARKWILLAAEQGHKLAINELALAYIAGGLDLADSERKGVEAARWIRSSADNGYLAAMEKLVVAYRNGELGFAKDVKASEQWAEKIRTARGIRQGRRNRRSTEP
ncbi:MAG: sel1 repeat family protein [Rhodocyclales bacterium]|nr:sel1 repeat family protein [Rhodocyclales bacterium]